MGELKRSDILEDDALMVPLILAKNLEEPLKVVRQILSVTKEYNNVLNKNADSNKKIGESVKGLTDEQKQLVTIQKQIATTVAKNNDAYIKYEQELQKAKQALKEKIALGEKDATLITKENASITQLSSALNKNRAAYSALTSQQERSSKGGKDLLKVIQQQDKQLKDLMASTGKHTLQVGNYEGAMKSLKTGLKAAKDEMAGIAATLGADSKEFVKAAEKAGKLKDEIGDLQDATKAVSGSPIENFGTSLGTVSGKLRNLDFKGASDAAKQFAQVSKTITFKEATGGIKDFGKTMLQVGRTLLTNPLFLLAAVFVAIAIAAYALKDKIKPLTIAFDAVADAVGYVVQKLKDFSDWMGISSFAADEKADRIVAAAKKEVDAINERYDREIRIAEAAGKEVTAMEIKKQQSIVAEAGKGYTALVEQAARNGGKMNEEQQKQFDEYIKIIGDANTEIQVIEAKSDTERRKQRKEADDKAKKDAAKAAEELKKEQEKANAERLKLEAEGIAAEFERQLKEISTKEYNDLKTERDRRIQLIQEEVISGNKLREDGEKEIKQILISSADDLINAQISGLQKLLTTEVLSVKEREDIEEKIKQFKLDATQATYDGVQNITVESTRVTLADTLQQYASLANSVGAILQSASSNRLAMIDAEEKAIDKSLQRQLKLAGDNEESKRILQEKADKQKAALDLKRIKEQRRAALFEKALAGVNAAINVAVAATNQGSKGDPYTALARVAAIVAALTPFAIAISKKDIPSYEVGTSNHPGGLALVGEKGSEMMFTPNGVQLTPAFPTLMNLPAGTEVIPHDETMRMIAMAGMGDLSGNKQTVIKVDNRDIVKAINDKPVSQALDIVAIGSTLYDVKKYKDGSVKYIRNKSLN